jgi:glycosyltransferase involved in cell wall biosynthesis
MIRFTIVTCVYNAEKVFRRTAESVLAQTYRGVEHLILDGASTDNTLIEAKDYMERSYASGLGHEVRITSEPDNGLYDAMNKGIAQASGDYIVFLNAGDVLPSADTLDKISQAVVEGESLPAVLYGDTDVVDDDGHFLRHRRLSPPENLTWRSFRYGMLVCHQAFYVRTDIAKITPYNISYKYSADVDWCIRVMKTAEQQHLPLKNIHAVVVNYLDGGMSIKNHKASLKERYHLMVHHYGTATTLMMHGWFLLRSLLKK